jgi:hypothetical protein
LIENVTQASIVYIRFTYVLHVFVSDAVFKNMQCHPFDATINIVPTPSSTTERTATSNAETTTVNISTTPSGSSTTTQMSSEEKIDFGKENIGLLSFQKYCLLYECSRFYSYF